MPKKQSCYGATPYLKIGEGCVSVRDCGELMVWNTTKYEFSCEPC